MPEPSGPDRIGVVLLGGRPDEVADVAERLGAGFVVGPDSTGLPPVRAVIGVARDPWPVPPSRHQAARERSDAPYYAVESWHRLPVFIVALAEAADRGRRQLTRTGDDHVVVTAPHRATEQLAPEQRAFLREVAQDVTAAATDLPRPTIAWDHSPADQPVTPTLVGMLATLAEAHDRVAVVRCAMAPTDEGDPAARAAADELSLELVEVSPTHTQLIDSLVSVAHTVVANQPELQREEGP